MKRLIILFSLALMAVICFSGCSYNRNNARANARNKVALKEIGTGTMTIASSGDVLGGFPAIFMNDSRETVKTFITKIDGDLKGYKWSLTIAQGSKRELKLETGNYSIQWSTPQRYNSSLYPKTPARFKVTNDARIFCDQTNRRYHGGYQILRNY